MRVNNYLNQLGDSMNITADIPEEEWNKLLKRAKAVTLKKDETCQLIELVQNTQFNPLFYGIILFTILPIRETLRVKGEMTVEVRKVHLFFIRIEKMLRKLIKR